jgi:hypothetical protein
MEELRPDVDGKALLGKAHCVFLMKQSLFKVFR